MRPVNAILRALSRVMRRDLGSLVLLKVNNFFLFVLFLIYSNVIYHMQPHSAYPFLLLVGFLLLFPMSSDPLAKIPSTRFGLWPLESWERLQLRLVSVTLSPVFWIALILLLLTARSLRWLSWRSRLRCKPRSWWQVRRDGTPACAWDCLASWAR